MWIVNTNVFLFFLEKCIFVYSMKVVSATKKNKDLQRMMVDPINVNDQLGF